MNIRNPVTKLEEILQIIRFFLDIIDSCNEYLAAPIILSSIK